MSALTAARVEQLFAACLFRDDEVVAGPVVVEGIVGVTHFHPKRVKQYEAEIAAMLIELPDAFQRSHGGGASFLNACEDRHGEQWTGVHQTVDWLFQLGLAIGKVKYCASREAWAALPGGMPYLVVG